MEAQNEDVKGKLSKGIFNQHKNKGFKRQITLDLASNREINIPLSGITGHNDKEPDVINISDSIPSYNIPYSMSSLQSREWEKDDYSESTRRSGILEKYAQKYCQNDLDFYTTELLGKDKSAGRYYESDSSNFNIISLPFNYFPLRFKQEQLENEFKERILNIQKLRIWVYCLVNCSLAVLYWAFMSLIIDFWKISDNIGALWIVFHIMWPIIIVLKLIIFAYPLLNIPEEKLEYLLIGDISLYLIIVSVWSALFLIYTEKSINSALNANIDNDALLHAIQIVNLLLLASFFSNILLVDMITLLRTRLTLVLHIFVPIICCVPYVSGAIYSYKLVNYGEVILTIITLISSTILCYLGRYSSEFSQRMMFCAWKSTKRKLRNMEKNLSEKKKKIVGTVVEDIINIAEQSQAIISDLKSPLKNTEASYSKDKLENLQSLLNSLITSLTQTNNLYSIRMDHFNLQSDLQRQFVRLYANDDLSIEMVEETLKASFSSASIANKGNNNTSKYRSNQRSDTTSAFISQMSLTTNQIAKHSLSKTKFPNVEINNQVGVVWNFDLLGYHKLNKDVLVRVGYTLLTEVVSQWDCFKDTLVNFLTTVESKYIDNPYHNNVHASMVGHSVICMAKMLKMLKPMTPYEHSSLVVAALCHDIGHPGRTNLFFQNCLDSIAIVYNDVSVLENFHASLTFRILECEENNIYSFLNIEEFRIVRRSIIELILATDMRGHFENISRFRVRKNSPEFDFMRNYDDRLIVGKILMKSADLSHSAVEWEQHFQWACLVVEEFYNQGDEEQFLNIRISPLCDRSKNPELALSQQGFLEFVVMPLLKELADIDSSGEIENKLIKNVEHNQEEWKKLDDNKKEIKIPKKITNQTDRTSIDYLKIFNLDPMIEAEIKRNEITKIPTFQIYSSNLRNFNKNVEESCSSSPISLNSTTNFNGKENFE